MANYATSALVKAQSKLTNGFQAGELRYRDPAVFKLYLKNTDIMIPGHDQLRTREDRVVEANYFLRTARSLGSARTHNHTGTQGDSGTLTPTWATYSDPFVSTLKEADNKIYSLEELHNDKLINSMINFAEGLETIHANYTFANRSGVNVATAGGTFNATDDTFEITAANDIDTAIQITRTVMDINKYQGIGFDVVCDSIAYNLFAKQAAQGTGNSTNTSFQFQNVTFVHDPSLTAAAAGLTAAYSDGYWVVIPNGMVATLPWIPVQNRMGVNMKEAMYGSIINPIDGQSYGIHSYEERVDGTSVGGYTQDVKTETQIAIDLAPTHAPLTVASETPLMAFALV